MSLFVDTSAWSLALRRDTQSDHPAVAILRSALLGGDTIVITGIYVRRANTEFDALKEQIIKEAM